MRQKKVFRLLAALRPEEFKRCRKAVHSPLFNTNPTVSLLFEAIRKQYPNFKSDSEDIEKLYAKLYPKEKYNDSKMRRLLSFLTQVVEDFIVYLELEEGAFQRQKLLVQAYRKRDLYDLFVRGTDDLIEELDTRPWQNGRYYFEKLQLEQDKYFHPQHEKYDIKDNTLEDLMDDVDAYYAFAKMQMAIALKNKARILNKPYNLRLLEAVDEQADGFMEGNVLYQLYRYSLHLLEEREGVDFGKYQELLFGHLDNLDKEDRMLLFYNGLNYANRQINRGASSFGSVAFDWYKFGLEKEIFTEDGKMHETVFGNIVHYGCKEKQFEWTMWFVQQYAKFLNEKIKADEVACSLAMLNFHKKDYDQVIFQVAQCSFSPRYFLRSRNIMIRANFEMFLKDQNEYPFLESTLKTFENHLYRNELFSESTIEPHLNFVQILRGLSKRILANLNLNEIKDWLYEQLDLRSKVISKNWLIEILQIKKAEPY